MLDKTKYLIESGIAVAARKHANDKYPFALMNVGDSFDWTLITLAAFALTVTQGTSGHTIVGSPSTAATSGSAARFRTRKTAANTFVTYRLA